MKQLLNLKTLFKYLFWIWLIIIFILSSLPNIPTQKINIWDEPFRLDYLEHFLVFGGLSTLYVIWKSDLQGLLLLKAHVLPIILLMIFAAADEIHQIWIPGRSFNPLDLIYNQLGLLTFFVISPRILKQFYKN